MKDFFKYLLATILGVILVFGIIFLISFGLFLGIMSYADQQEFVAEENTVIRIDFKDPIPERTAKDGLFGNPLANSFRRILGLNDIIKNIHYAADDENIKGIVLNLNAVPSGISTLREIRQALDQFKANDKFILCYGEYMTQPAYYLGSVADEIYVHPQGFIDFKGLNAQLVFLKGMFDKLEIEMQVVRHGKFKSAVEPLIQKKMSTENREQYNAFIDAIWTSVLEDISESRGLGTDELNDLASSLTAYDAEDAVLSGLISGATHRDEFREVISKKMQMEIKDINFVSLNQYDRVAKDFPVTADRLAIIYATGEIGGGKGSDVSVGSDRLAETIERVRKNENIKAVVLRVNSPGGDALASDVIWREMNLLKDEKPVIVSMGDVAASGGYWISCASDKIMADPTTLTGSIGVFGVIPNIAGLMENKIGMSFDQVQTNPNAGFPSIVRPLNDYERNVLESKIEKIYSLFLDRVSENRNMSTEAVDEIGEGRVWSGTDARRLGLIDEFGGLHDAVELASEIAGVSTYRILELPIQKDPLEQLIEDLTAGTYHSFLKAELGIFYKDYMTARSAMKLNGVQALLPVGLTIE